MATPLQEEQNDCDPCFQFLFKEPTIKELLAFDKWLRKRGGHQIYMHPGLCYKINNKKGFGIGARDIADLKKETVIFRIPRIMILSVRQCTNPDLTEYLMREGLVDLLGLTIVFLYECGLGKYGFYHEYLQCFRVPDVPRLWSEEEKATLAACEIGIHGDTSLVSNTKILLIKDDINTCYTGFVEPFVEKYGVLLNPPFKAFSLQVWQRAITVVASRYFELGEHGIALVPIADLFNHAPPGKEHIRLEFDDCPDCNMNDQQCKCLQIPYEEQSDDCNCTQSPCICRSRKRRRIETEPVPAVILDPNGRGWVSTTREKMPRCRESTLDIVLTRDVTEVGEIYNNYGRLSNHHLLSRYGFIIPGNPANIIQLRDILFDNVSPEWKLFVDDERREFWKSSGFEILVHIAQSSHPSRINWDDILESEPPVTGDKFVDWSICINSDGAPSFATLVWLNIAYLNPEEWANFRQLPNAESMALVLRSQGSLEHHLEWMFAFSTIGIERAKLQREVNIAIKGLLQKSEASVMPRDVRDLKKGGQRMVTAYAAGMDEIKILDTCNKLMLEQLKWMRSQIAEVASMVKEGDEKSPAS